VLLAGPAEDAGVPEFLFYHLERQPLEAVLPRLIERSLDRGWRVVVQAASDERVEALDAYLWTYRDESFLPHGTSRDRDAAGHPVLLTAGEDNPNGATVRFLIEGAAPPADVADYERLVLLFDGGDDDAIAAARQHWRTASAAGFAVTYWQQNEQGRWERRS
jgi:DNA polymerase-3 subunit chi